MIPVLIAAVLLLGAFRILLLLYDHFWQKGLGCEIQFTQDYAVEDETSALSEVIVNRKLLPLPVLEISFHMDRRLQFGDGQNASLSDMTYRRDVFAAAAQQKITRRLEFKCAGRGYFRISEAGLTAQDLFLSRKYVGRTPQNTDFYVLPRPVPTSQIQIPYARIMGAILSRKRVCDDPFEFGGLREYSQGDPMKYINWKATARAGKLLINLHESTLSQQVTLLIDMEAGGLSGDYLNEAGIRVACSLAERLLTDGVELGLYSNGGDVQSGEAWKLESVSGAGFAGAYLPESAHGFGRGVLRGCGQGARHPCYPLRAGHHGGEPEGFCPVQERGDRLDGILSRPSGTYEKAGRISGQPLYSFCA